MKKKLIKAAAIVVLLLLFLFLFLEYRQAASYNIPIHANADMIVKINADAFIKTFIKEYGFSFRKKISRPGKTDESKKSKNGLQLPANIFIYSVKTKNRNTFFCTLKLKNADQFKRYLERNFQLASNREQNYFVAQKDKFTVLFNNDYAVLAFSPSHEYVTDIQKDLLNGKNLLAKNHTLIKQLKKNRHHITVVSNDVIAAVNLSGNNLVLEADVLNNHLLVVNKESKKRVFDKNACAFFYCNAKPLPTLLKPVYQVKNVSIESDSILQYWNGYADAELLYSTLQKDTVTTYEYDDNFEKKEIQTITEVQIPLIHLLMDAPQQRLFLYLQKQGFISRGNTINKEIFPLYNVAVTPAVQGLLFSTGNKASSSERFVKAYAFFKLYANFNAIRKEHNFPLVNKYTLPIQQMEVTATLMGEKTITINGSVQFDKPVLTSLNEMLQVK